MMTTFEAISLMLAFCLSRINKPTLYLAVQVGLKTKLRGSPLCGRLLFLKSIIEQYT